jgi:TRAP-type C4-dicarboxylate transport system permease small subunit
MGRLAYLGNLLLILAISVFLRFLTSENDYLGLLVVALPLGVWAICCHVRRWHDVGKSGWYVLLLLIPIANIFILFYLLIAPGVDSPPMAGGHVDVTPMNRIWVAFRLVVHVLAIISGLSVLAIMLVTCADVVLRITWIKQRIDLSFAGAYDIVKIAGALSLAAALPYTTAVKGHVAIEYFFHKFNRSGRLILDTVIRLLGMELFAFFAWRSVLYGLAFLRSGQGSLTLQLPIFWVPWFIAFCCGVVVLVIAYNLTHPGREMIKP